MEIYSFIGKDFEDPKKEPKKENKVLKFMKNVWKKKTF